MPGQDGAGEEREMEAQELQEEEDALLVFSRYSEQRAAVPWDQRTLREKVSHYLDRIFLVFLALFLLVLMGEILYKLWYVTSTGKLQHFLLWLFSYFLRQEEEEELLEL